MKILCCGDQHWTDRKPKNRTDAYFKTVLRKLNQEIDIAINNKCECIIFPGDLFDSFKENHLVVQSVMKILQRFDGWILAVAGQHDQQYHNNNLQGTPIHTLVVANLLHILNNEPLPLTKGVEVYGASWNEEIPEIKNPDKLNILVIHKMIVDEKLWAQQEGHTWANHILMKNGFDLIVSGDNHTQFTATKGKKHLVNMGSMMRSTIAQVEHTPAVAIYDTIKETVMLVNMQVESFDEVMSMEKAIKEKEKNLNLDAFVASLKDDDVTEKGEVRFKLDFMQALKDYIVKNDIPEDVSDVIYDCV